MRHQIAMLGVLAGLLAGLGCQHIGGKCDCGAHPSDAIMTPPNPPYAVGPATGVPVKSLPTPTPIPMPKPIPNG